MVKILIADDSAFMRKIVRGIVEKAGHKTIIEASDGGQAAEMYRKEKQDVVLMDIIMAPKTGLEALEEIKAFDKKAKVIMITAVGQEAMIEDAKKLGCIGYVLKPFKEEAVVAALKKALA